uniref:Membrane steroid-binding protein 2 n=1 Tax=Anthurium amnicola TaxID=1678845 RepID=A0A1D1YLY0_9ARAE
MAMALYAAIAEAIHAYTGLSPAAFFTILALMVGVYRLVSGMFVAPEAEVARPVPSEAEPLVPPEPVQIGDVSVEELRAYDGSDPKKPLLMAIKGQVYDVSRSRMFYGPGGPYALFAGRDASRALALMSFDPNDLTGDVEGLSTAELDVLQDWEYKFMEKYVKVGQLVTDKCTEEDDKGGVEMERNLESQKAALDDSKDSNCKDVAA